MIEIKVATIPVAQPRQRHRVANIGGRVVSQNYTPASNPVNAFKARLQDAAEKAMANRLPLGGALRIDIVAVFPRPKGLIWKRRPMPRIRHTKKPDRDNLDKACLDALRGIVFHDDCQACEGGVQKWIASGAELPHVIVRVAEIED